MAPLVTLPEDLEDENNKKDYNSKFFHDKDQDWQNVDMVAWILLLCITIECFIEGRVTSVVTYNNHILRDSICINDSRCNRCWYLNTHSNDN